MVLSFAPLWLLLAAPPPTQRYIAFYKPVLTLCSFRDDQIRAKRKNRSARETLFDYPAFNGLHTAGRLDRDSEGLLVLTNDGQFTHYVCSGDCIKTYWVCVHGIPDVSTLEMLRRGGLSIRGAVTQPPVSVDLMMSPPPLLDAAISTRTTRNQRGKLELEQYQWLCVRLREGRNRQIRRMMAFARHPVLRLVRVQIGKLALGDLKPGEWRDFERSDLL